MGGASGKCVGGDAWVKVCVGGGGGTSVEVCACMCDGANYRGEDGRESTDSLYRGAVRRPCVHGPRMTRYDFMGQS